jgi:hypothetical protein
MGMLTWVTMGLAIWHFSIFVPDRFAGGIIGAFLGAVIGAGLFGLAIHGLDIPGRDDTDIMTALEAVPGALIGLGVAYVIGARQETATPAPGPAA